jgi:translocation and assembly module TamB
MKILRWVLRIVAALLLVGVFAAWWALRTESGSGFVLARVQATLGDKLAIRKISGTLAGPLILQGVRYRDSGIDAQIERVSFDAELLPLWSKTLHIRNLELAGLTVASTTQPIPTAVTSSEPFSTQLPLSILLDRLHLERAAITQDGKPVFALDTLDSAARWTASEIVIGKLALRAPDGSIDLNATVANAHGYRGGGKLSFDWQVAEQHYVGNLDASSDGSKAITALVLAQPIAATLRADVVQNDVLPWTLALSVPSFDAHILSPASTLKTLAAELSGQGDKRSANVAGWLTADAHRINLDPLKLALDGQTLKLLGLTLTTAEAAGKLHAQGEVKLDTKPVSAQLALSWEDVVLPANLAGQTLASHGEINAQGSAEQFVAQGKLSLGPPGQLADIVLDLSGTPQAIALKALDISRGTAGSLDAHGTINLQPQLGWDLTAKADKLNPGAFAKDWPGAINFSLLTQGTQTADGPAAIIKLSQLSGTLRQRPLSGNADLKIKPKFVLDGTLDLNSGKSEISVRSRGGEQTDADITLVIASLGDWLPKSAGSVRGQFHVNGKWPAIDVNGQLDAQKIVSGTSHVDSLNLRINAHDLSKPQGQFDLHANGIAVAQFSISDFTLKASGNQAAHQLQLDAVGTPLSAHLSLSGGQKGDDWYGALNTLLLQIKDQPNWTLQQPASIVYSNGDLQLGEFCLKGGAPSLCISATQMASGAAQGQFRLEHLPLAMLAKLASPESTLKLNGEINGNGDFTRASSGALSGKATLNSASGGIVYPDDTTHPLLSYENFAIDIVLSPQQIATSLHAAFNDGGRLDGKITLDGAPGSDQALNGKIEFGLKNLGFIELFTAELVSTKGQIDGILHLGGSSSKPNISGDLALTNFASEVPSAGLKLHDGAIKLNSSDGEQFTIDGTLGSGAGMLSVQGTLGVAANAPLRLHIKGDNFTAADIPAARAVIAPNLNLIGDGKSYRVDGEVELSSADIDLAKLPGGGTATAKRSADVVIVGEDQQKAAASLPITADVTIKLGQGEKLNMDLRQGQEIKLKGFGLDGTLAGQLVVSELPGRPTSARGQINVNGTYKAYGQDLKIQDGRLLFAGPIDNPGLDIRAIRVLADQNITAGVRVQGTANRPALTVYSDPVMDQSEALSYLVLGKPLRSASGNDSNRLGAAAAALGTASGDLLAKSIGGKLGVDDIGVADNSTLGGAAFSVGKYLSPRLYVSYGVGIFTPGEIVTLRYKLTERYNIEVQSASTSNRAGINYRYEH